MRLVCLEHGVTRDQMSNRAQTVRLLAARRDFCIRCRAAGISLPRIGRMIGRHHTTALHYTRMEPFAVPADDDKPRRRSPKPVATKFKADYTEEEIDRMTRRVLGRAWD
jgi:hypothetical protein